MTLIRIRSVIINLDNVTRIRSLKGGGARIFFTTQEAMVLRPAEAAALARWLEGTDEFDLPRMFTVQLDAEANDA